MNQDTIQIDYEQLQDIAQRWQNEAEMQRELTQRLQNMVSNLQKSWQGRGADAFFQEMEALVLPAMTRLYAALDDGGQLTRQIIDIFQVAEEEAANGLQLGELTSASVGALSVTSNFSIGDRWTNFWRGVKKKLLVPGKTNAEKEFNILWDAWEEDQREQYLQDVYRELAAEYGLEEIPVKIEDLPDRLFGLLDARGVYTGHEIKVDIDNLQGKNGNEVVETLTHETRHQIQAYCVALFREHGESAQFPGSITLEQVREWDSNFNNYVSSEDDFEGYFKQPIESDARQFADEYVEGLITSI